MSRNRGENPRSELEPAQHKGVWYARGWVPERSASGAIIRRRRQFSLAAFATKAARQAECDRLNRKFEQQLDAPKNQLLFVDAYTNYINAGHEVPLKHKQILAALGGMQCVDINDTVMGELRKALFDTGHKASHANRNLYSPVISILNMASKITGVRPNITRPVGHKAKVPISVPADEWLKKLSPHLSDRLRALVAFLTIHGRRLGDALNRYDEDFDPVAGTVHIGKDKQGNELLVQLLPIEVAMIGGLERRPNRRLFGWDPISASSIRRDIAAACKRAGVPYYSPHKFGRHAFATRMLRAGYSLQYVKDAGDWATIEMVSERYGHLAKAEVTEAVHKLGADVGKQLVLDNKVGEAEQSTNASSQKLLPKQEDSRTVD